jgi:aquaporin Z
MTGLARRLLAEFIGVFAICFVGILSITHAGRAGPGDLVRVALAFGLTVAVMVACFASVSGAHFNPAATCAFLAVRRISFTDACAYIAAQLVGALAASWLLAALFGTSVVARGCTVLASGVGAPAGAVLEALATFLLFAAVFGTAVNPAAPRGLFPWAIGLTVTLDIFAIGPLTGASLNPARSFGPALVGGVWGAHWVFWLGPIAGAVAAALLSRVLYPAAYRTAA